MGIILMLLASVSFATMSALIKAVGQDVPSLQVVFLRCALSVPILLFFVLIQRKPLLVRAKKVLLFRTLFGMTAMIGFFYAIANMPLAECVFIGRSQPLILAILAPLIIGEKAPRSAWFAIATGFAGVALIMKPAMAWPVAAWVTLGAALASALAHLLVRRLNATDDPLVIVFNFSFLAGIFTSVRVLPHFVSMSGTQWIYVAGIVVFACIGQILMTMAYRKDLAPAVASSTYSAVFLSVLFGYLFWGEIPHPLAWLGGALIVTGGLMLLRARIHIRAPASPAAS
jgi:drug/metabolite transporter (DMT)-like permease